MSISAPVFLDAKSLCDPLSVLSVPRYRVLPFLPQVSVLFPRRNSFKSLVFPLLGLVAGFFLFVCFVLEATL